MKTRPVQPGTAATSKLHVRTFTSEQQQCRLSACAKTGFLFMYFADACWSDFLAVIDQILGLNHSMAVLRGL